MDLWERYSYRVFWSEEDREHVAVCVELPGLSWLEKSPEAALRGIRKAAREALALLEESGDPTPEPLFERRYSGVFKVRIPPEVHRRLTLEASEQNVSLNRLVSAKLSQSTVAPVAHEVREVETPYGAKPTPVKRTRRAAAAPAKARGSELEKPARSGLDFSNAKPNRFAGRPKSKS